MNLVRVCVEVATLGSVVNHLPSSIHLGICGSSSLKEKPRIFTGTGGAAPPLGPWGLTAELHQGAHADLSFMLSDLSCGWMAGPLRVEESCCGEGNVSFLARILLLNIFPMGDF